MTFLQHYNDITFDGIYMM